MQLFKLDEMHYPSDTVQMKKNDSLVWVERYQDAGDFQLVIENDISVLITLPLGTLISHTDTYEVMIVENHEVVRDSKRQLKVTVSGRGFETFAENRTSLGSELPLYDGAGNAIVEIYPSHYSSVLAMMLLERRLEPGNVLVPVGDEIPNLSCYTDLRVLDPEMDYTIKRGDVYSKVLELLRVGNTGLKTARPNGEQTTMDLMVHDGKDNTESVIFYAQYADLDDAKYFWSIKDYKNYARIATHIYADLLRKRDVLTVQSGLNRRILYVEADDLEGAYVKDVDDEVVVARGQLEMFQHPKVSLLQATISNTARPKFKINYDVGDLVTVFGEFGATQVMRVTEHILTIDKDGMRGFPSLTII